MKKLIALAVALIMVLALVPMTMAAQLPGGNIVVGAGQDLTYDLVGEVTGRITINDGGKLTINGSGTFNGGIDINNGELILNGGTYLDSIYVQGVAKVYVGATAKVLAQIGNAGIYVRDCDGAAGDDIDPEITIDVYGTLAGQWDGIQTNGQLQDLSTKRVVNIYPGAKLYPLANAGDGTAAIYAAGYMIWNIYGGSFKGETCLSVKCGVWNISGGEFLANGAHVDPATSNSNGSEDTGAALSITSNASYAKSMSFNITGGTFVSEQGNALYEGIAEKNNVAAAAESYVSEIKIKSTEETSPTFYAEKEAVVIDKAPATAVAVTGGTYSDNSVLTKAPGAPITIKTEKPTLSETNSTLVTIKSEVTYTVVIPAVIDFGTMKKTDPEQTKNFNVELRDAFLGQGARINIKVNSDFEFVTGFGYRLVPGGTPEAELYCSFTANGTNEGHAYCNPTNMPYAGTFTDTMVFSIDYVAGE